jgi:flagellin
MSRIQTNIAALNAHRNLSKTGMDLQKSIQRLSTGFRINRAADDAAGLSIANKLRSDVRAMRQASRNAQQANSLLAISDGALSTLSGMMDRMKELATQAASDNVSATQRSTLNDEYQTLVAEFDRIVNTTQYQGSKLLDGSFGTSYDAAAAGTETDTNAVVSAVRTNGTAADTYTIANTGTDGELSITNAAGTLTQVLTGLSDGAQTITFSLFGVSVDVTSGFVAADATSSFAGGNDLVVAGATQGDFLVSISGDYAGNDNVSISNVDVAAGTLGIDTQDLLNLTSARDALTAIDNGITSLASAIGSVGVAQSQLEFALQNVTSGIENIAAAESVIRDADMAFEMIDFTKAQILQQAGTAMLAQANAAPQSILSLLAG